MQAVEGGHSMPGPGPQMLLGRYSGNSYLLILLADIPITVTGEVFITSTAPGAAS